MSRVLAVPRERAWAAFNEAEMLARWWGPNGFTIPGIEFDPRPKGSYRIEMRPPDGAPFALAGEFREVEAPARLVFTFRWDEPDPDDVENVATLLFVDLGDETEVLLTQAPFKTDARLSLHRDGWSDSFDKLERLLAADRA